MTSGINDSTERQGLDPNELISLNQAAQLSGLSPSHIRLLVRKGVIWGKKMGRDWFTNVQSIQEYLQQERKPGPKAK